MQLELKSRLRSQEDSWLWTRQGSRHHLRSTSEYPAKTPWCTKVRRNCMHYGHTHLCHSSTSPVACLRCVGNRYCSCRSFRRRQLRRCRFHKRGHRLVIHQRDSQMGRTEQIQHCIHHRLPRRHHFHMRRLAGWSLELEIPVMPWASCWLELGRDLPWEEKSLAMP